MSHERVALCGCGRPASYVLATSDRKAVPRRQSIACDGCLPKQRRWVGVAGPFTVEALPGAAQQGALF